MVRQLGLLAELNLHREAWQPVLILLAGVFLLSATPLRVPFKWAETFYHEFSHGLAALLTGGRIGRIQLRFDGSGVCTTRGGSRTLILLAGYAGAALWGGMLYLIGGGLTPEATQMWLIAELTLLGIVFVLWARDPQTWLILLVIAGVYALGLWLPDSRVLPWLFRIIGLYVLCNALKAPLVLIDGQSVGDGADLQRLYWIIPEIVWVMLWFVFALAVLVYCMARTVPGVGWALGI
ncbi:MAG TPA: M50 family metallopeptidase [Alphaproteobacteria bacterium]|nr:M50 family metallopeptidase [Alphaproteobacteria bacterium]